MEDGGAAYQVYVGVDIAAETFTAAWLAPGGKPTTPFTSEQTPVGFAALRHRLQGTGSPPAATLVVLEATGNYWVALAVALHEAGYRVAVVNPRQAHHCAKAQLRRAKTDALDARDLAHLAAALIGVGECILGGERMPAADAEIPAATALVAKERRLIVPSRN